MASKVDGGSSAFKPDDDGKDFHHDFDEVLKVLNIRKPRKGEALGAWEQERIYKYMLELDEQRIASKGGVSKKELAYLQNREQDEMYRDVNDKKLLGAGGIFQDVSDKAIEESWRSGSRPYGIILHKRYLEWLGNLPSGPSQSQIKADLQHKADHGLWDNIVHGRDEKPKRPFKKKDRKAKFLNPDELRDLEFQERDPQAFNKAKNFFDKNRAHVRDDEQKLSLQDWDVGVNYPYDYDERGFPVYEEIVTNKAASLSVVKESDEYAKMFAPKQNSPGKFIKPTDIIERSYKEHRIQKNIKIAERYVTDASVRRKEQEKQRAKERKKARKSKRRVAALVTDIATGAAVAKTRRAREPGVEYESDGSDSEEEDIKESSTYLSLSTGDDGTGSLGDDSATARSELTYKDKLALERASWSPRNLLMMPAHAAKRAAGAVSRAANRKALDLYLRLRIATTKKKRERLRRFLYHQLLAIPVALDLIDAPKIIKHDDDDDDDEFKAEMSEEEKKAAGAEARAMEEREKAEMEQQLVGLTGADRKRKLFALEEDKKKRDRERADAARREAFLKKQLLLKQAVDNQREDQASIFTYKGFVRRVKKALGLLPPSALSATELLEQKRLEDEKKRTMQLRNDANNASAIEMMFTLREKQREAEEWLNKLWDRYRGRDSKTDDEFKARDLINAARAGNYFRVIDLLQHPYCRIEPDATDEEGVTALYMNLIQMINNEGVDDADAMGDFATVFQKWYRKIKNFFFRKAKGAKLDTTFRILLHRGANINHVKMDKDADGEGVMHLAALGGSDNFINWMVSKGGSPTVLTARDSLMPLQYACKGDKLDTAFLLLKIGSMAYINHQDRYGYTALHYAAIYASEDFCVVLLICGADATLRAKNNRTAQEEAAVRGRLLVVEAIRTFKQRVPEFVRRIAFQRQLYTPGAILEDERSASDSPLGK